MFIRHIAYIPGPFSCFAISLKYTIFFVITSHISHISYSVFTFCPRHHFHFSLWCAGLELECRFNCAQSFLQQAPEMRYLYGKYKVLRVWWICVIVCLTDSASDFRMTTFIYNKHRNMVEEKKTVLFAAECISSKWNIVRMGKLFYLSLYLALILCIHAEDGDSFLLSFDFALFTCSFFCYAFTPFIRLRFCFILPNW